MDNDKTLEYKNMSVEEIITDLYEQHLQDVREGGATVARFFLGAAIALIISISLTIFQSIGSGFTSGGWITGICWLVAGVCVIAGILCAAGMALEGKYEVTDFSILVRHALMLKYGECSEELLEQYMKSKFVHNFIKKIVQESSPEVTR